MPSSESQFKPGQSGNPNGRPRLPEDLKRARLLSKPEFQRTLDRLIRLPISRIEEIAKDPETPALELLCATVIAKGISEGDQRRLDFILERLIGRVKDEIELSMPKPTIIQYKGDKMVLTTDRQEAEDDDKEAA